MSEKQHNYIPASFGPDVLLAIQHSPNGFYSFGPPPPVLYQAVPISGPLDSDHYQHSVPHQQLPQQGTPQQVPALGTPLQYQYLPQPHQQPALQLQQAPTIQALYTAASGGAGVPAGGNWYAPQHQLLQYLQADHPRYTGMADPASFKPPAMSLGGMYQPATVSGANWNMQVPSGMLVWLMPGSQPGLAQHPMHLQQVTPQQVNLLLLPLQSQQHLLGLPLQHSLPLSNRLPYTHSTHLMIVSRDDHLVGGSVPLEHEALMVQRLQPSSGSHPHHSTPLQHVHTPTHLQHTPQQLHPPPGPPMMVAADHSAGLLSDFYRHPFAMQLAAHPQQPLARPQFLYATGNDPQFGTPEHGVLLLLGAFYHPQQDMGPGVHEFERDAYGNTKRPRLVAPGGMLITTALRNRCPRCHKQFKRPSSLATHMNSHTGEKPFVCPWKGCSRAFSVRSNMTRHMKLHTSKSEEAHTHHR